MLLSCYEITDRVRLYLKWRKEDGLKGPAEIRTVELSHYVGVNRTALYRAITKMKKTRLCQVLQDKHEMG